VRTCKDVSAYAFASEESQTQISSLPERSERNAPLQTSREYCALVSLRVEYRNFYGG